MPGLAALKGGLLSGVTSVSCGAAGDCASGGYYYTDGGDHKQAFVVSETNGTWGNAIEVPGTAALNSFGKAGVTSVSCGAAGDCAAVGSYTDGSRHNQAFVADYGPPCVVPKVVGMTLRTAKTRLAAAHCGLGRVKRVYANARRGHVVAQYPRPGRHLRHGAKVALTVSKGTRR